MPAKKLLKKTKKTVITPRDYMQSTPIFKFPPMPTNDYMVVYRAHEDGKLFGVPVDFIAVCEYSNETENEVEFFESICFIVFVNDGGGFFEIISPDTAQKPSSNRLGVVTSELLNWRNEKSGELEPIYKWDKVTDKYVHPTAGTIDT